MVAFRRTDWEDENMSRKDEVRAIVGAFGRLPVGIDQVDDHQSLYAAGLTSHASVDVMLALEDHFGLEFPERYLQRATFESVANLTDALDELLGSE